MTHISAFRLGGPLVQTPCVGKCGEVRIGYFDPRTGEPCDTKPEPLRRTDAKPSSYEAQIRRKAAEAEAAEIERGMRERNAKRGRPYGEAHHRSRPVLVDGVVYPTVGAAALYLETPAQYLGSILRNGRRTFKGHSIGFAEGGEARCR